MSSAQGVSFGARPVAVEIGFWIAVVVPLLVTVVDVVGFTVVKAAVDGRYRWAGGSSQEAMYELHDAVNGVMFYAFVLSAVIHLVLSGLWMVFGFAMRDGRNWARIALVVLASLWVLVSAVGLIRGDTEGFTDVAAPSSFELPASYFVLDHVESALGLLAMGSFIALVLLKQSNRYFSGGPGTSA
ncbi:hypothetical protein F1721_05285 [Saccharopolyspora hirsuta]|uniref:Uncharacterized protein n=1 Tax=Saccharopolyspora hirsuta TaxID=1837 RepID=A0A5M7CBY5_SACHI|nr:hypothetical protein [Saccharopolyspora hirsuta]KAA5837214.1 hypothetical protein F1721_05285 [Saccharopolyspora hirsuta]